ncbi:tRNA glutamyl-Q(34) synthetase GluQRS [Motilimonas cestriensis]|uniref:Glutamyl-Q tRNA(Asp) synthetase n=1 Tax=Motilimonas cestriensis TaxID=2742685 RepID=A0ABS8WDV4_9GAMM|nr:tRNA glutamyl-Q(34) synthetase GluQRS [Motilimonas cestriensis]MCE2596492.1 tRNA glutamyl-Q(34) synthetase GluQRS [Motilimonas cestriensis]
MIPPSKDSSAHHYIGRFAPSPSGPLHFGSLIAALGSYLQAKSQQGSWLVRIEDIDPPREVAGADQAILRSLEQYGLHWDQEVRYQSQQSDYYEDVIAELKQRGLCYACQCTRAQIKQQGGLYLGHCRQLGLDPQDRAIRLQVDKGVSAFIDKLQGEVSIPHNMATEDFIIKRKDGLFAYNLAVTLDDIQQGITEVVRGADLLLPTARQIGLMQQLKAPVPDYVHLPLAVTEPGFKLSKQNHAPAISDLDVTLTTWQALAFLGQQPPPELQSSGQQTLLNWAVDHWSLDKVAHQEEIILS